MLTSNKTSHEVSMTSNSLFTSSLEGKYKIQSPHKQFVSLDSNACIKKRRGDLVRLNVEITSAVLRDICRPICGSTHHVDQVSVIVIFLTGFAAPGRLWVQTIAITQPRC